MIKFYRMEKCDGCDAIQDALSGLRLACEVSKVQSKKDLPDDLQDEGSLPLLVDEGKIYNGHHAIAEHLEELEAIKGEWYKFQSDACYCDDEGNII